MLQNTVVISNQRMCSVRLPNYFQHLCTRLARFSLLYNHRTSLATLRVGPQCFLFTTRYCLTGWHALDMRERWRGQLKTIYYKPGT